MFALETYAASCHFGIPAIIATFDKRHQYPNIGLDLCRLTVPDQNHSDEHHYENRDRLSQVVKDAVANHKLLIVDLPAGFILDQLKFEVLQNSGLTKASSSAALVPILSGNYGAGASAQAIQAFDKFEIRFDRGLIRRWKILGDPTPPDMSRAPNYPVWRAECLSSRALKLINQEVQRIGNPAFNTLPRLCEMRESGILPSSDIRPIHEAVTHLDSAT